MATHSPDLDGKGEGSSHLGLGIGSDVVKEAVVEPSVVDTERNLAENVVHGDAHELQRSEALPASDRGRLYWKKIHRRKRRDWIAEDECC